MNISRGLQLAATLAIFSASMPASFGCTIVETLEPSDTLFVFIGKIQGYVSKDTPDGNVYGISIEPLIQFQSPKSSGENGYLSFPPNGLSGDCRWSYYTDESSLRTRYPLHSNVVVWANELESDTGSTSRISVGQRMDVLPDECVPSEVAKLTPNYNARRPACGSLFFHAHKELAQLDGADQEELISVLTRLAEFPHFVLFEDLVESLVDDTENRNTLINLRYSDAIERGCAEEPENIREYGSEYFRKRSIRGRWFEYCTIERRKAARDGA